MRHNKTNRYRWNGEIIAVPIRHYPEDPPIHNHRILVMSNNDDVEDHLVRIYYPGNDCDEEDVLKYNVNYFEFFDPRARPVMPPYGRVYIPGAAEGFYYVDIGDCGLLQADIKKIEGAYHETQQD